MKQAAFARAREARWQQLGAQLDALDRGESGADGFPALYRGICQDLALARDRGFDAALVDRLNDLALRGHQHLYGRRGRRVRPLDFLARRFPAAVRREAPLVALASLLFFGSGLLCFALDLRSPTLIYSLLSGEQVMEFEAMYDPEAPHYGAPREASGDFSAFAYYVANNVAVAFRTFAWGTAFGVGSLLVLGLNGVVLGLLAAHLTLAGASGTFFPFVIGHGALELPAIALAGVAGLRLGAALVAPGRASRALALRRAGQRAVPLLYGTTAMLGAAAILEAFWSASPLVPAEVKLAVGAVLWGLVLAWLCLAGRGGARAA